MAQWLAGISFLFGVSVGSFLNVVILRGEKGESLGGRSRCNGCGKNLTAYELIPVLSYLWQKGRCRGCGIALSLQYPLVEFGTGLVFFAAFWWFYPRLVLDLSSFVFITALFVGLGAAIVIFVSDLRFQIIPNGGFLTLLILGIISTLARNWSVGSGGLLFVRGLSYDGISALILSLILAALWFFSGGSWMGFGDVKLILALALILGFPASMVLFVFSFWLGGLVAIILLLSGKGTLGSKIPFGPFLLAGSVLAYFFTSDFLILTGLNPLI